MVSLTQRYDTTTYQGFVFPDVAATKINCELHVYRLGLSVNHLRTEHLIHTTLTLMIIFVVYVSSYLPGRGHDVRLLALLNSKSRNAIPSE